MFGLKARKKKKLSEQERIKIKDAFVGYLKTMNLPTSSVAIEDDGNIVINDEEQEMFIMGALKRSLNGEKKKRIRIK